MRPIQGSGENLLSNTMSVERMMDMDGRREEILAYLREEGYCAEKGEDRDLLFGKGENSYRLVLDEECEVFYTILYLHVLDIRTPEEEDRYTRAAVEASTMIKAAKVIIDEGRVIFAIEQFASSAEEFCAILPYSLTALRSLVDAFAAQASGTSSMEN